MTVLSLMTANPVTIGANEMLSVAEAKMRRGRFRRLPVVDDSGDLVGIVADGDLRQQTGHLSATRVTAAMIETPVTVQANAPIETAAELMLTHKIGGLPVVTADGTLAGIVTETDLLRAFLTLIRS